MSPRPVWRQLVPASKQMGVRIPVIGHCVYCGWYGAMTKDHVVPIVEGGRNAYENIVLACRFCNGKKGRLPVETFRAWLLTQAGRSWLGTLPNLRRVKPKRSRKRMSVQS